MAITDRARDYWDRISPRERNLVLLLAVATPIVLAIWLGSSIHDGLDAMGARNDHDRKALAFVEEQRAAGAVKPTVDDSIAAMTTEPLELSTYIDHALKQAKIDFKGSVAPRNPITKAGFVTNTSSLQIEKIDIQQAKDFLSALETGSKVVAVTDLKMNPDFHDKDKVTLSLDVTTYSKVPPSDTGSGGSGGAAAAGTGGSAGAKGI